MLSPGFHNKSRYGFWSYRVRTENLALIRRQMGVAPVMPETAEEDEEGEKPRHCAVWNQSSGTGSIREARGNSHSCKWPANAPNPAHSASAAQMPYLCHLVIVTLSSAA